MGTGLHGDQGTGEIHIVYNWEYADQTAREAATGFVAADVGKLSRQLDDNSLWFLSNHDPITWVAFGSVDADAIHDNVAGEIAAIAEKATPVSADLLLIEDSAAANVKKKVQVGNVKGGQTDTVAGANGATNTGNNVDAVIEPVYGSTANTVCEGNDARLSDARTPTAHKTSHESGGSDEPNVDDLSGELADPQKVKIMPFMFEKEAKSNSAAYEIENRFIFPGTTFLGTPTNIKVIAAVEDVAYPGDVRIYDRTNSQQICEKTGIATLTPSIFDMGTLANLPAGEAIFEMQLRVPTVADKEDVIAYAIEILF